MKKIFVNFAAGAVAIGLSLVAAQGANAATLYEGENYGGSRAWTATTATSIGNSLNDKASSLRNVGTRTYYEDTFYGGRLVTLAGDRNSLQAIASGLHFGETWNDRISSFN